MKRKRILSAALCALMTLIATSPADAVDPTRRTTPAPSGSTIPNTFGPNTFGNNPFYNPNGSGGAINPTQAPANLSDPTSNNLERNRNNLEMTPNDSRLNPYLVPQNPNDQLPGEPNKPRWTLGVYSRPTEVGEQILQVVSDTAAMRAGLEPNDIIIAVGGYQVGTVNGDTFDLSREFNMRADQSGNVNLLVQDHRNQQLVNVPVKLESRFSKITGSIAFRDRLSIPAGAVCTVELREVVRDGAPVVPLSRTVVDKIERIPIPFEIEYDPEQIDSRRDYTVHATITNANRTLYASRTDTRVITDGYPTSRIALSVEQLQNQGGSYTREQELDQLVRWFREYLQRLSLLVKSTFGIPVDL